MLDTVRKYRGKMYTRTLAQETIKEWRVIGAKDKALA